MLNRPNVAVTIRTFDVNSPAFTALNDSCELVYINTFRTRLSETELCEAVQDADGVIAGTEPFTGRVFQAASRLSVISRVGVGVDSIDVAAASDRGIKIFTTPLSAVQPVAEHTIALILCVMKNILPYHAAMQQGDFSLHQGRLLQGKHAGIIGLGRIGFRVAELLSCFGCSITYFDPFVQPVPRDSWIPAPSLEGLLAGSDIITLHAPAQQNNTPLLDRNAFHRCRRGVIVINTARGSLIDERALIDALEQGVVAGAGLDVFPREPYSGRLLSMASVITTPHVASNTLESRREMEGEAVRNLLNAFRENPV
jgi:D-3-phosphoglycerate dehydrogenase